MIFFRPRSDLGAPSKLWPWIVLMESRRGGLVIPEIRVGEEAMSLLWLVEVGVEGVLVPVPVPVLVSEVLTAGAREASPNPERQKCEEGAVSNTPVQCPCPHHGREAERREAGRELQRPHPEAGPAQTTLI